MDHENRARRNREPRLARTQMRARKAKAWSYMRQVGPGRMTPPSELRSPLGHGHGPWGRRWRWGGGRPALLRAPHRFDPLRGCFAWMLRRRVHHRGVLSCRPEAGNASILYWLNGGLQKEQQTASCLGVYARHPARLPCASLARRCLSARPACCSCFLSVSMRHASSAMLVWRSRMASVFSLALPAIVRFCRCRCLQGQGRPNAGGASVLHDGFGCALGSSRSPVRFLASSYGATPASISEGRGHFAPASS